MRAYAFLREPAETGDLPHVSKIMLFTAEEGVCLFEYSGPDDVLCSADRLYGSLEDLYDDWNGLIDEKGWIRMEDPLPGCQQDAFLPLRVRGRDAGKPEWGKFEVLEDGKWVEYRPV